MSSLKSKNTTETLPSDDRSQGKTRDESTKGSVDTKGLEGLEKQLNHLTISNAEPPTDTEVTSATSAATATATPQGIGSESLGQNADVLAENKFIRTLHARLNGAMSEKCLGAVAVVSWGEEAYQAMFQGVIAGLFMEKNNFDLLDFYKSEVWLSTSSTVEGIKQNKDYESATAQPLEKGELKRADIVIRFKSGTLIFIELKYVPLRYLRLPKLDDTTQHQYTLVTESNAFTRAPTVDQTYKEEIETLKNSKLYASEDDILLASLHNGGRNKPTVNDIIDEAGEQVVTYANFLKKSDATNVPRIRAFVFTGVWRKTFMKEFDV